MPHPGGLIKVLLISHDQALRDRYISLFRTAGYFVHTAGVQFLAITLRAAANFDVLVLDHTLSQQERKTSVYIAKVLVPQMHTLVLHSSGGDNGADLAVDSRKGVPVILEAVAELVGPPPLGYV